MTRARRLALLVLVLALAGQLWFGLAIRDLRPGDGGLAAPPGPMILDAAALGDRQGLYRILALEVQNLGDGGGRFLALNRYDYGRVVGWLTLLDQLEPRSAVTMALAGALYGQTPDPAQARMMADYLYRRARQDPVRNWHWLATAAYLARHRAHDPALAMTIALDLAKLNDPKVPAWTRAMPDFILSGLADQVAAQQLREAILASHPLEEKAVERLGR